MEKDEATPELELVFITVDCRDAEAMLAFWSQALGWEVRRATYTTLRPPNAATPGLFFQQVEDPTPGKNRMHMDLVSRDRERTIEELVGLGGSVVSEMEEHGLRWTIMADPEDNVFCVFQAWD